MLEVEYIIAELIMVCFLKASSVCFWIKCKLYVLGSLLPEAAGKVHDTETVGGAEIANHQERIDGWVSQRRDVRHNM